MNDLASRTGAADARAIENIKAAYCRAVDRAIAQPEEARRRLNELLHQDATADYGFIQFSDPAALIDFLLQVLPADSEWLWHSIQSPHIEVNGDAATAEWTLVVKMKFKAQDGPSEFFGRYQDNFERTPHGWKIKQVSLLDFYPPL